MVALSSPRRAFFASKATALITCTRGTAPSAMSAVNGGRARSATRASSRKNSTRAALRGTAAENVALPASTARCG